MRVEGVVAADEWSRAILVVESGEVVLKSRRVRPRFEKRLIANIRSALRAWRVECGKVTRFDARIVVGECSDYGKALDAVLHVFGVHAAADVLVAEYNGLDDLASRVAAIAAGWVKGRRFAVRAKRSGREPFTSLDIARRVGELLLPHSSGVDLENPDVEVYVEARGSKVFLHRGFRRGPGGLPVGVEGRALALFSGGLDSPLAVWYTAKRGVEVDGLHFVLASTASLADALRVWRLETRLWLHGYKPKLLSIDFRPVTRAIAALVSTEYRQVVLRAAMLEAAGVVARREGYMALVTGESLGQVSSQTLANLYALAETVKLSLPLLRPLIGMDKEEITAKMREVGLYGEASRTREYCRLAEGPVTTRANPEKLRREYEKVQGLALEAAEEYAEITYPTG